MLCISLISLLPGNPLHRAFPSSWGGAPDRVAFDIAVVLFTLLYRVQTALRAKRVHKEANHQITSRSVDSYRGLGSSMEEFIEHQALSRSAATSDGGSGGFAPRRASSLRKSCCRVLVCEAGFPPTYFWYCFLLLRWELCRSAPRCASRTYCACLEDSDKYLCRYLYRYIQTSGMYLPEVFGSAENGGSAPAKKRQPGQQHTDYLCNIRLAVGLPLSDCSKSHHVRRRCPVPGSMGPGFFVPLTQPSSTSPT